MLRFTAWLSECLDDRASIHWKYLDHLFTRFYNDWLVLRIKQYQPVQRLRWVPLFLGGMGDLRFLLYECTNECQYRSFLRDAFGSRALFLCRSVIKRRVTCDFAGRQGLLQECEVLMRELTASEM